MRLRRLELIIVGVTLAFSCFIGGYFTGRVTSAVSVTPAITQQNEVRQTPDTAVPPSQGATETKDATDTAAESGGSGGRTQDTVGPQRNSDGRININSASRSELMDLPGIGSVLSERIVEYRRINGPFSKIEDLRNVSGIGEKRFETVKDKITV